MMTLRQIEVIRAVMVTGTIGGAAKLLNVSAPGISRLVKYTEKSLGIRFFQLKGRLDQDAVMTARRQDMSQIAILPGLSSCSFTGCRCLGHYGGGVAPGR